FPAILAGNIVDSVFEIVGCVLLLKASKDDNRYLLIPWLVYNSICILYNLIGAIHFLVVSLYVGFAGLVGGLFVVFLSIRIYFFLIVAVYYKLLLEGIIYVVPYPPTSLASLGDVELNANRVTVNVALPRSSAHDDSNDLYDGPTARFPIIVTI
ncbi:hypothetical protein BIW11_08627, partial [Tropilaelaps mercedesae]